MKDGWLLECVDNAPPLYIRADGSGLTYDANKAKPFATREDALNDIARLNLSQSWTAIAFRSPE